MGEKKVKPGDTISAFAREYGFSWEKIWNHDRNKELRDRRGHPNVLYPGDRVYIPEPDQKFESRPSDERHRFRKLGALEIRIAVVDIYHKPLADVEYFFVVEGKEGEHKATNEEGIAETRIASPSSDVMLHLPWGEFPLELGYLDPARTVKGLQQRLRNFGIDPGPIDGILGPKTARAIREFQEIEADGGLSPTGQPDEKTIRRLRELHDGRSLDGNHNLLESHFPDVVEDILPSEIDDEEVEIEEEIDDSGASG